MLCLIESLGLNSICVYMLLFCLTFFPGTRIFYDGNKIFFFSQHSLLSIGYRIICFEFKNFLLQYSNSRVVKILVLIT
jgi:hypothetical protein